MRSPWLTLMILIATAIVTLITGSRISRKEVEERIPVDRAKFREFGDLFQAELARLEDLYERDLMEAALLVEENDLLATRRVCEALCGVRECNFVPIEKEGAIRRIPVGKTGTPLPPGVAYRSKTLPNTDEFVLDAALVRAAKSPGSIPSGWLQSRDGKFAAFWLRRSDTLAVVLVVELEEVVTRTNDYLGRWLAPHYSGIAASQINALQGPVSTVLAGSGDAPGYEPEYVHPLRTKFGVWQLLGWAKSSPKIIYDPVAMATTVSGALFFCLLGFALFQQQRSAERLAKQRVSFVNRVSHELSSPLTNLSLNLDLASDWLLTRPADARRRLALVNEEVQRLSRLVQNVLTFSRSGCSDPIPASSVCIPDQIISSVIEQFAPALERAGIRAERHSGAGEAVRLDADALAQIVGNLISNVEKYAGSGGVLMVRSELRKGSLRVRVIDRGPGIAREHRQMIFLPFERINERVNEGISGTGLGLSIARDLAERMGGSLTLQDAATGAVFLLEVPAPILIENIDRTAA